MNNFYKKVHISDSGQALLLVLGILSVMLLIGLSLATTFLKQVQFSTSQSFSEIAAGAAGAGIEHTEYKIMEQNIYPNATSSSECLSDQSCFVPATSSDPIFLDNGASYITYVSATTSSTTVIKSIGTFRDVRRSFEITFYK